MGDELGGHIVSGHVDGLAKVIGLDDDGDSTRMRFARPMRWQVSSRPRAVALNGTSLTVNEVAGAEFGINLIPHSKQATTWADTRLGDRVNLEIDTLARYVARMQELERPRSR